MIKQKITINGTEYTVRSSTPQGVADGIAALKKSVKRLNKQKPEDDAI